MSGEWPTSRRTMVRLLVVFILAVAAHAVHATVLLPADFQEMTSASQLIVHGRVSDVRGELAGRQRAIETVVTVEVLTPLKGAAGDRVSFRVPGGRVGRYRRVFVGAPVFRVGDEVVLFLEGRSPSLPMPFGLSQGVYRVSRATGNPVIIPVPAVDGVAGTVRGDPARRPIALEEFARQVRLALEVRR